MAALEKKIINSSKRIVIKVGSGLIRGNNTALVNENFLTRIVKEIIKFNDFGKEVLLVSSGALALGKKVLNIAYDLLEIAKTGLINRNINDGIGNNESIYLNVLEEILQKQLSPAKELLKNFYIEYDNSIEKLLRSIAY